MFGKIQLSAAIVLAAVAWTDVGCSPNPEGAAQPADSSAASNPQPKPPAAENSVNAGKDASVTAKPVVVIETSLGTMKAELWPDKAPQTVDNFLRYVDEGFYNGLIFHRVINGFMIQGGGFSQDFQQKPTHAAVRNEASSEAPNARGTLAMARTSQVDSATAQFFINLADNRFLNHQNSTPQGFGYCVFGRLTEGMDVLDKIGKVPTGNRGGMQDVPVQTVEIKSIRRAQ